MNSEQKHTTEDTEVAQRNPTTRTFSAKHDDQQVSKDFAVKGPKSKSPLELLERAFAN